MKLTSKNFDELQTVMGDNAQLEFDGGVVVFKTDKGSFIIEKDGGPMLGISKDNEVFVMPKENTTSVRYRINQFLPDNVKLTSKNSVMMLNGKPLKKYNLVTADGGVMMEDE